MAYIIVTTDDLQPATLPFFSQNWKPLKQRHPTLKLTAYVSPYNQEFGQDSSNFIGDSEAWQEWWEENSHWVEIVPHGFNHQKPPENLRDYEEQKKIIKNSLNVLSPYLDMSCWGYKAPFYRANSDMVKILVELGCSWYSQWWNLHLLKPNKIKIPNFIEIPTHCNLEVGGNPDNIDKIYIMLDERLTQLEQQGHTYTTFGKLVKEATG